MTNLSRKFMDNQQKWVYLLATTFKYMEKTDYLSELKKPHLSLKNLDNGDQVNRSIQDYLTDLEKLRLLFVDSLSSCREAVALAYLDELVDIKKVLRTLVEGEEDVAIPHRLFAAYNFPFPSRRTRVKFLYGLIESVEKTIDFVKIICPVPPTKDVVFDDKDINDEEDDGHELLLVKTDDAKKSESNNIIKGVKGLAKYLACGNTKAQAIINSKILEKEGIQWNAGGWRFDAKKLEEFRINNPTAFEKVKCPH